MAKLFVAVAFAAPQLAGAGDVLASHPVVLDGQGILETWVTPPQRFLHVAATLPWAYLKAIPPQPNGLPTYYAYAAFDPATGGWDEVSPYHNPAGLYAMLAEGAAGEHAYSGDREVLALVQGLLDHQLAHGTTPASWEWANVPFASADSGDLEYGGGDDTLVCGEPCGTGDGASVIEPDKVGELGWAYLLFHRITGQQRYLDAALACADALLAHRRAGDGLRSPWPFRVRADTGEVREEYTANALGPIRLFDALVRLGIGDFARYRAARDAAWSWVLAFPLQNGNWSGYFEDQAFQTHPSDNLTQYVPLETARFMMEHPDLDPSWREHVPALLDFVEGTFGVDNAMGEAGIQAGAIAISEQFVDMYKMGSHTARFASVQALWWEASGDPAAREKARRSFTWASYMCDDHGRVTVGPSGGYWFTDGYGDYTRHFLAGMGAVPDWAPPGEAHVLRASSPLRGIAYGRRTVSYSTAEPAGSEVLRLPWIPARVVAGGAELSLRADAGAEGYTVAPLVNGDAVIRVRHDSAAEIQLSAGPEAAGFGCGTGSGGLGSLLLCAAAAVRVYSKAARRPGRRSRRS